MKTRKFLFMALLSGVLMLSGCDLSGQNKKNKSEDEDEIGNNFQPDDYKGEQGATQLSEEDWNKAFSIEETVMHRSVKVAFQANSNGNVVSATTEIDHGKMKMSNSYNQGMSIYVNVNSVEADGTTNYTYYYQDSDGSFDSYSRSDNYKSLTIDLGILEYSYDDFTYDSSSKTYKSGAFTYQASSYQVLEVSECEITIKDGFPAKVTLEGMSDGELGTFTATYSNYGKVKVSIPNQQPSGGSQGGYSQGGTSQGGQGQSDLGREISYSAMMSAFNNRPQPNFNHAEAVMTTSGYNVTYSANLVNGDWVTDGDTDSMDFDQFIITADMMASLSDAPEGVVLKYYQNSSNNSYAIYMEQEGMIEIININQYFYITGEIIQSSGTNVTLQISWSRR